MSGGDLVGLIFTLVFTVLMIGISLIVTVVSVALPLGVMWFLFKQMQAGAEAERKLIETGIAAPATIVAVNQTGMFVNHNPQVRIDLEVVPPDGEPYTTAVVKVMQMVHLAQLQTGKVIEVRFDPENPKRLAISKL